MRFKIILGLLGLFTLFPGNVKAEGRARVFTQPVLIDEGRNPVVFSTNCPSGSWSVVFSSDALRRAIVIQAPGSNTGSVCVSTATSSSEPCNKNTPGIELPANGVFTDHSTVQWNCQAYSGVSGATLKGVNYRDKGDTGMNDGSTNQ